MSDYTYLTLARQKNEQHMRRARHQIPKPRQSRRQAVANGLHRLADRIDI